MNRLKLSAPDKSQSIVDGLFKEFERRIESAPSGLCLVDMTKTFTDLCLSQSCGKCAPCRIGLEKLSNMLGDILKGTASEETLAIIEKTARNIYESADCAIGYEAALVVINAITDGRDVFLQHIHEGKCTCSYKQPVPCVAYCPAGVDIPGYISLVREGRFADAIRLIRKDNPFPTTCGFICEHPCEAGCRRNIIDSPINIRGLKRMAAEYAGEVEPPKCHEKTGKKVAIIGGGPSGLSAAYFLSLMGHEVCVYEGLEKLGGMLRYGIPNYRLPKDRLDNDINAILKTGVKYKINTIVGKDISFEELKKQYDAVYISIGASTDKKLGCEGEDADGVISAVKFLRNIGLNKLPDLSGQEVIIVGGGNVSMDAARSAVRCNAKKVSIVYRRRVADMTALPSEIEGAASEGVEIKTLKAPLRIEKDENGHIKGLWTQPQMISEIKDGRASVKANGDLDEFLPCDTLIVAIGQNIDSAHFAESGIPTSRGAIKTLTDLSVADIPGVFAGGDCATGPATVVRAIAAAKVAAANIDEYLGFRHPIAADVTLPAPSIADRTPCGRVNMTEREASVRSKDFDGIENPMTSGECLQEASRCLGCDHFGYGAFRKGRECKW